MSTPDRWAKYAATPPVAGGDARWAKYATAPKEAPAAPAPEGPSLADVAAAAPPPQPIAEDATATKFLRPEERKNGLGGSVLGSFLAGLVPGAVDKAVSGQRGGIQEDVVAHTDPAVLAIPGRTIESPMSMGNPDPLAGVPTHAPSGREMLQGANLVGQAAKELLYLRMFGPVWERLAGAGGAALRAVGLGAAADAAGRTATDLLSSHMSDAARRGASFLTERGMAPEAASKLAGQVAGRGLAALQSLPENATAGAAFTALHDLTEEGETTPGHLAAGGGVGAILGGALSATAGRPIGLGTALSRPGTVSDELAGAYETLGVHPDAGFAEVKSAFRRAAKRYHPDANAGDPLAADQYIRAQQAYETISRARDGARAPEAPEPAPPERRKPGKPAREEAPSGPPPAAAVDEAADAKVAAGEPVVVGAQRRAPGEAPPAEAPPPVVVQAAPEPAAPGTSVPVGAPTEGIAAPTEATNGLPGGTGDASGTVQGPQTGPSSAAPEPATRPFREPVTPFVQRGAGDVDFGRLPAAAVQEAGLPDLPVRLTEFRRDHIWEGHEKELAAAGFASPDDYVAHVLERVDAIYEGKGNSIFLARQNGHQKALYVEMRPGEGGYWHVNTGHPVTLGRLGRTKKLLWESARGDSDTDGPGGNLPSAVPPPDTSGGPGTRQRASDPQQLPENVADSAPAGEGVVEQGAPRPAIPEPKRNLFGEEEAPTVEQSGLFSARDLAPAEKAAAERVSSRAMNAEEVATQTSAARAEGAAPTERDDQTAELFDEGPRAAGREQRTATFHKTRGAAKALSDDALLTRYRAALRNHMVAGTRADAFEGKGGRIKRDYADPDQPIGMVGTGAGAFQRGSQTQADARLAAYEEEIRRRSLPVPHPDEAFVDAKTDDLPLGLRDEHRSLRGLDDETLLERWGLSEENAASAPDDVEAQVRRAMYAGEVKRRGLESEDEVFAGAGEGSGPDGLAYAPKRAADTARLAAQRQRAEERASRDGMDARMQRAVRGSPRGRGRMGTPKERADQASSPATPSPLARPTDPLRPDAAQRISADLRGRLQAPPKPQQGKPVSAPQVLWSFGRVAKAAGKEIPLRVGRLGTKSARGLFKIGPEVIRILEANDIPTSAHEVAHAVEKLLFGWPKRGPWVNPRVDRSIQRELLQMGRDLYGDHAPTGGYKREGWAEYVRMWLTTDGEAQAKAPNLTKWFDGPFSEEFPQVRRALDEARELAERWRTQGSKERAAQSMVDTASFTERAKRKVEKVRAFFTMEQQIEMAAPLERLARAAERSTESPRTGRFGVGRRLAPDEDPYVTISSLRLTHSARTRYMVEHGMIDLAGNVTGPALDDIRALVGGRKQDFTLYLWARRAEKLWLDPEGPRNPGLSLEDAQQILQELDSPEFQLAAGKVYQWNEGVLDYAAQASPTFAHVVEKIRERDPGDYVPLQREFEELDAEWSRGGPVGSPKGGRLTKRLKGSGRRVKDPFQAMIAKAEATVRAAHERLVIDQILRLSKLEGLGHIIEEVPVSEQPAAAATIREILHRVNQELAPEAGVSLSGGSDVGDLMGRTLTFFAPAQRPDGKAPIIPLWENGKMRWFEVAPDLYHALASLDVYRLPDIADLLVGAPNRAFRAGTTGLRASFGLLWNPFRDWQTLFVNTQSHASGGMLFAKWLQSMAEAALYRTAGKASPWIDAFVRMGGEMSQPLGQDIPHTRRAAHRLFQSRRVRILDPHNWFDFYRDLVQFPETAARVTELRMVARDIGWKPGEPMSLSQSMQLLLAAKQVTTDFTAAGEFARRMNQIVPFYNSAIQGPRASIRAARRSTSNFVIHGLQLTAASLLLWWMHKDEDWYKEMPFRERFLNWHFPFTNPVTGREELVRLPRAFDTGAIFSAMPELFLDAWYRDDPKEASAWFTTFMSSSNPMGFPVLMNEAGEQLANKDFFWKTPIVPRSEEHRPAEEQFNEYTSRAAIVLGQTFGVSPRRIDHAIGGVFGPAAEDLLGVLGLGPKGVEREKELADTPILGRIFQRGGAIGTHPRSVDALYDALEAAQQRQHSQAHPETPAERQQRLQLEDAAQAISALSYVRSKTPSAAEREKLTAGMLAITGDALQLQERGQLARGRVKGLRKRAEWLESQVKKQPAAAQSTKR